MKRKQLFLFAIATLALCLMTSCKKETTEEPDVYTGPTITATYMLNIDIPEGLNVEATQQINGFNPDSVSDKAYLFIQQGDAMPELPYSYQPQDGWTVSYTGSALRNGKVTVNRNATNQGGDNAYVPAAENNLRLRVTYIIKEGQGEHK